MCTSRDIIKKWLDNCEREKILPWKWDFKLELITKDNGVIPEIRDETNPIKRIFEWYLSTANLTSETETTTLAKAIYSTLWDIDIEDLEKKLDIDVMNSFWTTYKFAISQKYDVSYNKWYQNKINTVAIEQLIGRFDEYNDINVLFESFAKVTHTIGNFVIEPRGFNMGRKNDDFWDLGLTLLKEYFDIFDKSFWEKNVNTLLLHPFIKNDFEVAELWNGHFKSQFTKPFAKNIDETLQLISQFLNRVCQSIEERGKFITKTLCEKIERKDYRFYETELKNLKEYPQFANELWDSCEA